MSGKCYNCVDGALNATQNCANGSFTATDSNNFLGTTCSSTGACTYRYAECTNNGDCASTNLCNGSLCMTCLSDNDCTTGSFANAADESYTSATCNTETGMCSFGYPCANNGDCATTNLCVETVCTTCVEADDCKNGSFAADSTEKDYDTVACTDSVCVFTNSKDDSSGSDGLSGGAIAGIIIGSVCGVLLIVVAIYFLTKGGSAA